jgi:hypothetical protein
VSANITDARGDTPLIRACSFTFVDTMELLLDRCVVDGCDMRAAADQSVLRPRLRFSHAPGAKRTRMNALPRRCC